jgi:hypothetical protein
MHLSSFIESNEDQQLCLRGEKPSERISFETKKRPAPNWSPTSPVPGLLGAEALAWTSWLSKLAYWGRNRVRLSVDLPALVESSRARSRNRISRSVYP